VAYVWKSAVDTENAERSVNQCSDLFTRYHCFRPRQITRQRCRRVIPKVLLHLGRLKAVVYASDRGTPGHERTFVHHMQVPPRLVCDPAGTQLYILGGNYRVTHRGIEG
jgi:hypothetical protein